MQFTSVRVRNFRSIEDSGAIPLGPVTVVVGRNNCGKSALLHAVYRVQHGADLDAADVRLGARTFTVDLTLGPWAEFREERGPVVHAAEILEVKGGANVRAHFRSEGKERPVAPAAGTEPDNAIHPVFTTRRQPRYEEQVRRDSAFTVGPTDGNLVSRVMAVSRSCRRPSPAPPAHAGRPGNLTRPGRATVSEDGARTALARSAGEVITVLREIEQSLVSLGRVDPAPAS